MKFEKDRDFRDNMGLRNPHLSKIQKAQRDVEHLLDNPFHLDPEEINFREYRRNLDLLKSMMDLVVIANLNRIFGFHFDYLVDPEGFPEFGSIQHIATGRTEKDGNVYLYRNSVGSGYSIYFPDLPGDVRSKETPTASSLEKLISHIKTILKRYKMI